MRFFTRLSFLGNPWSRNSGLEYHILIERFNIKNPSMMSVTFLIVFFQSLSHEYFLIFFLYSCAAQLFDFFFNHPNLIFSNILLLFLYTWDSIIWCFFFRSSYFFFFDLLELWLWYHVRDSIIDSYAMLEIH